ncbi:MAG: non-homologous end-joining DNA ligase [Acidimicrobiia bacterium]|nr:non-homologous end-joining DNA ligase [Acidimicrobiia bacterium]
MSPPPRTRVEVAGRHLSVSNLDKVLYPARGTTKAAVIDYAVRIAPVMLPYLRRRPVTFVRWPDGVESHSFFEKNCPGHRPDWVEVARIPTGSQDAPIPFCLIEEPAALAWAANLAALELHVPMATVDDWLHPTGVVFDLDPGAPAGIADCARVALRIRDLLARLDLTAVAKTSGSKGLHVFVPLNSAIATSDDTRDFALALAGFLESREPDTVTANMRKELRTGRVFVDWSQNTGHKTTVCAYSLRGRPRPTVSTPVTWDEVSDAADSGDVAGLDFEYPTVLERVDAGDHFHAWLDVSQELPVFT